MKPNKVLKARKVRNRVKLEKARLRKRIKKHKQRKWYYIYVDWNSLKEETRKYLLQESKIRHCSVQRVIRECIRDMCKRAGELDGIQKEHDISLEQSSGEQRPEV